MCVCVSAFVYLFVRNHDESKMYVIVNWVSTDLGCII